MWLWVHRILQILCLQHVCFLLHAPLGHAGESVCMRMNVYELAEVAARPLTTFPLQPLAKTIPPICLAFPFKIPFSLVTFQSRPRLSVSTENDLPGHYSGLPLISVRGWWVTECV